MTRTLPIFAFGLLAGCGALQDHDDERTNAEFTAPLTVKRNGMVEVKATYRKGSNGKPLQYRWHLDRVPDGSAAALKTENAPATTFMADVLGEYEVTLVVDDGRSQSAPVTQMVKAVNSAPEVTMVTQAGRNVGLGEMVQLEVSGSDCDQDPISFRWYFDHLPEGSNAEISDPTGVNPTFIPDLPGLYAPRVVGFDGMDEGEPHGLFVWAGDNDAPIAVAGNDREVSVGETVRLDGSSSNDPVHADEILRFSWRLASKPSASRVDLVAADQVTAEVTPDVAGDYVVELVVRDELEAESAPDQVTITAR